MTCSPASQVPVTAWPGCPVVRRSAITSLPPAGSRRPHRAGRAGWADRPDGAAGPGGTRRTDVPLGTRDARDAGLTVGARVALRPRLTRRPGLALGAGRALGTLRARGAGRAGLAHRSGRADRALGAGRSGRA